MPPPPLIHAAFSQQPETEYIRFPGPSRRVPQTPWLKTQRCILLFLETRSPNSRCWKGAFLPFSSGPWLAAASCPSLPLPHVALPGSSPPHPSLCLSPSRTFDVGSSAHLDNPGLPSVQTVKDQPAMQKISGLGRSPGVGNGNPSQYSCLRNPMHRGAWRAAVHRVTKSRTRLK